MFGRSKAIKTGGWLVLVMALLAGVVGSMAHAIEIIEQGNDYSVIAYEAGVYPDGQNVAWVTVRHQNTTSSGTFKINNTIQRIETEPGWTYKLRKSGGLNGDIQLDLSNGQCSAKFSLSYKPGKTVLDSGAVRCR